MSYFLKEFPDQASLLEQFGAPWVQNWPEVNNHIHTPFSFSAFSSVEEAVDLAASEGISILGINDFNVCDGHESFVEACKAKHIFPLLNMELIGISQADQQAGIRVNDPNNPGRTYLSGKGLAHPSILPAEEQQKLNTVVAESNRQVGEMIRKLNSWLDQQQTGISLSVEEIQATLAEELLRERHVVKMLRLKLEEAAPADSDYYELLERIYDGKAPSQTRDNVAGTENELRSRLLKAGAPAYVPEDDRAFLPVEEIADIIRAAGGIPTYPMLLDGTGGDMTDFEKGKEQLCAKLRERGYFSVEMIPMRNKAEVLQDYVAYFYEQGFVVSFGTEHNTSSRGPLTVLGPDGQAPADSLREISFKGACYQAAHQYLLAREGRDYRSQTRTEMEQLGQAVFCYYFSIYAK